MNGMFKNMGIHMPEDAEEPDEADVMAIMNECGFGGKKAAPTDENAILAGILGSSQPSKAQNADDLEQQSVALKAKYEKLHKQTVLLKQKGKQ